MKKDKLSNNEILQLVCSCPKIVHKQNEDFALRIYNILFAEFDSEVRSKIKFLNLPSHAFDDLYMNSWFILQRCITSYTDSNGDFKNYFLKAVKNGALRWWKHNKTSYFSRNESEIIFSADSIEFGNEEVFGGVNDKELEDEIVFDLDVRFQGDDLKTIRKILDMIEKHFSIEEIKEKIQNNFLIEWVQFQLQELFNAKKREENHQYSRRRYRSVS